MKKDILFLLLFLFSFPAIHAEITWSLSDDGTLTISGKDMPDYLVYAYSSNKAPWYNDRDNIKNVVIKDGVTNIGSYAFCDCSRLTSVVIPNSVTSIGDLAFYYCSSLTSVTIPNSVTSIGDWVFFNCTSLTSVEIPNSVTSIGNYAFTWCAGLTSVTIPNSVTSIGDSAFSFCIALCSITFKGSTPPAFGNDVFEKVNNSISVYVPSNRVEAYKKVLGDLGLSNIQAIPPLSLTD